MTTETIQLSSPIQIGGIETAVLSMREPLVGDVLAVKPSSNSIDEVQLQLISNLCQMSPADLRRLSWKDYMKIQGALSKYMMDDDSPLDSGAGNS